MLSKMNWIAFAFFCVACCSSCLVIDIEYPEYCSVLFGQKRPVTASWMNQYGLEQQLQISGCGLVYSRPRNFQPIYILIADPKIEVEMMLSIINRTSDGAIIYAATYMIYKKVERGDVVFGSHEVLMQLQTAIERSEPQFLRKKIYEESSPLWE